MYVDIFTWMIPNNIDPVWFTNLSQFFSAVCTDTLQSRTKNAKKLEIITELRNNLVITFLHYFLQIIDYIASSELTMFFIITMIRFENYNISKCESHNKI